MTIGKALISESCHTKFLFRKLDKEMKIPKLLFAAVGLFTSMHALAENTIYVTPYIGYTFSNNIRDENQLNIDIDNDIHYALGLETDFENGRVGLFISHQKNEASPFSDDGTLTYVHMQSALHYQLQHRLNSFIGASIGTTILDVDWSDSDLVFSAGIHGGMTYQLADNFAVVFEARWLANLIDSDTSTICTLPTGNETCNVSIDSEWLTQFQTNLGLTYSF